MGDLCFFFLTKDAEFNIHDYHTSFRISSKHFVYISLDNFLTWNFSNSMEKYLALFPYSPYFQVPTQLHCEEDCTFAERVSCKLAHFVLSTALHTAAATNNGEAYFIKTLSAFNNWLIVKTIYMWNSILIMNLIENIYRINVFCNRFLKWQTLLLVNLKQF